MIVTISNVNGIKQYNVPDNIKKIIIMILVLVLLIIGGLSFYVATLHSKISKLEHNNRAKKSLVRKQEPTNTKKHLQANVERQKEKKKIVKEAQLKSEQLARREKMARLKQEEELEKEKALLKKREEVKLKERKLEEEKRSRLARKAREEKLAKLQKEKLQKEKLEKLKQAKTTIARKEKEIKAQKKRKEEEKKIKLVLVKKGDKRSSNPDLGTLEIKTFGCLGLSSYMYTEGKKNTSTKFHEQSKCGKSVKRKYLKPGDLLFFYASKPEKGTIGHMGVYIGNNMFIHTNPTSKRSVITSLNDKAYKKRYMWARRVR